VSWKLIAEPGTPFGRMAPRVRESGQPDLRPLSVYLGLGVVPRDEREDNFNRLGEDLSKYLVVRPGDVVFNKLRTWQGGLGVSAYTGLVSPAYFVCRPVAGAHPRYLGYVLTSAPYLAELTRVSKWMPPSQFDISWEDLKRLPLELPPFDTQVTIADFLDAETSRIDAIIATRDAQLRLLDELERAHIDASFAELRAPVTRLGRLVVVQTGVTVDAARAASQDDVEAPYLRVANVQPGRLDLGTVTSIRVPRALAERSTLRAGDVLMTEGGDIDKLGRGTVWNDEIPGCLHQNHVFAVRPTRGLNPDYLAVFTRTSSARAHFESTGVQSTNLASTSASKVRDLRIPLATPAEQARLVARVETRRSQIGATKRATERSIELLRERKQSLMTAAVTGQVDITREIAEEAS
jgi:type I restriction enzyme, S subunit